MVPFFGIGNSIVGSIVKVHNEDPTSVRIDREAIFITRG